MSASPLQNIGEQLVSAGANVISDALTTARMDTAFGIVHDFPYPPMEYGSVVPAMYPDPVFGSKAPVMSRGTTTLGTISASPLVLQDSFSSHRNRS